MAAQYGITKMLFTLGGLHIEKQIEQTLGAYFEGSDLTDLLVLSKVMSNSDSAFLSGSFITRTKYNYQVVAVTLDNLLHKAFTESGQSNKAKWINEAVQSSAQFKYWYLGLELVLKFLIFVKSIREAKIELYISILSHRIPWFLLFDHQNYARYATANIVDLWNAKHEDSPVYELLKQGIFTVNKSDARFSNIHLDQNHEQLHDYLKKCGGIVGLTEDPEALKRFLVCSPLVSQLCKDFEDVSLNRSNKETGIKHHHAELPYLQERFLTDKEKLRKSIISQGNPFSTSKTKLINIYSHEEAPSSEVVYGAGKNGEHTVQKLRQ